MMEFFLPLFAIDYFFFRPSLYYKSRKKKKMPVTSPWGVNTFCFGVNLFLTISTEKSKFLPKMLLLLTDVDLFLFVFFLYYFNNYTCLSGIEFLTIRFDRP